MKKIKALILLLAFCSGLLISSTSCVVLVKEDNGRHRGWFKNPKNPHNVFYSNPQKGKSKGNNKK
jgi:hypothetical protein